MANLAEKIQENILGETTSNSAIRALTTELSTPNNYSAAEINAALHTIKMLVKQEVVESLDKQISTFKHFLGHI